MCFGGGGSSSTTSTKIDPIERRAKNIALSRGLDILNQSYVGYDPTRRVAPWSPDQLGGFQAVRDYAGSKSSIPMERTVDQNGVLGKISDYIDPYIKNALAPALRDIHNTGAMQRNDIGGQATMAGAFGDARHGIADSEQRRLEDQAVGDTSSRAYSNAYQSAMAQRAGDLDRLTSSSMLKDQSSLNRALSLLGAGDQQQQHTQQESDALYQEFQNSREWPFRQFDLIAALTGGTPTAQQTTTQTQQPNNSLWQLLGSLGGAYLGG